MRVVADAAFLAALDLSAPAFWQGAAVGMALALGIAITWSLRERHRRREAAVSAAASASSDRSVDATPVRRPVYLDRGLLNDLLAHAEPRDFGKGLRSTLADDDLEGSAGDTRLLNKVIAGLRRQRHLIDLDQEAGAPIASGRAMLLTCRVAEHASTELVARAERRVEAQVGAGNGNGNGNGNGRGRTRRRSAPLVLELTDERSGRSFVGVVDTRRVRREGRAWLAAPVSVLAVVDEVLSSEDTATADRVLADHLDADRLGDLAQDVPGVRGPGALVSIAALYR